MPIEAVEALKSKDMDMMSSEHLLLLEESERNENWFRDHHDELVEKFDGEHVAIL